MKSRKKPQIPPEVKKVLIEIALKLRDHRKAITGNYEDFAANHGFNKVTIYRLETGKNFNMGTLIMVLRAMNITIEDFFAGIK